MTDSAPLPTAAHLAGLRLAREAALIVQFCDGKVLGEVEMAEVAHILPPEVLGNPPLPDLARSPEAYAAEIGTSKRTIFRWQELGRRTKDPVPLDEPAQMLSWWSRRMSHKVPDYLNDWVSRAKSTHPATVPTPTTIATAGAGATGQGKSNEQPDREAIDMKHLAGHGLEAAVHILRQNVEATAKLLGSALKDPNDQSLSHYQSRFENAVEQLRKAEGSLLTLQKARGDLAPRAEFRSDLVNIALGLRGMLRRRADNVCATLAKALSPEHLGLVRAALAAEAARDEKLLRTARFWQELPNGELQLPAA